MWVHSKSFEFLKNIVFYKKVSGIKLKNRKCLWYKWTIYKNDIRKVYLIFIMIGLFTL